MLCSAAITIKWYKCNYITKGPQFANWRGQLHFLLTIHPKHLLEYPQFFWAVMVIPYIEDEGCFYSVSLLSFATSSLTAAKRKKKAHLQQQWVRKKDSIGAIKQLDGHLHNQKRSSDIELVGISALQVKVHSSFSSCCSS